MLAAFVVVLRSLAMLVCGHRAVALENLALRQQLAVFKRTVKRPPLHRRDRLFWMLLAPVWRRWRTALFVVRPDTVVRWHRQWLRWRWTRRSRQTRPGRPSTNPALRALVMKMAAWTAQHMVEAFPDDTAPRWLLRDRDTIYGDD